MRISKVLAHLWPHIAQDNLSESVCWTLLAAIQEVAQGRKSTAHSAERRLCKADTVHGFVRICSCVVQALTGADFIAMRNVRHCEAAKP